MNFDEKRTDYKQLMIWTDYANSNGRFQGNSLGAILKRNSHSGIWAKWNISMGIQFEVEYWKMNFVKNTWKWENLNISPEFSQVKDDP